MSVLISMLVTGLAILGGLANVLEWTWLNLFVAVGTGISAIFLVSFIVGIARLLLPPPNSIVAFQKWQNKRRHGTTTPDPIVILCLGDSITAGSMSDPWTLDIPIMVDVGLNRASLATMRKVPQHRWFLHRGDNKPALCVVNGARNGATSFNVTYNLWPKASSVAEQADYIMILVGTNNCLSIASDSFYAFLLKGDLDKPHLPTRPTLPAYEADIINLLLSIEKTREDIKKGTDKAVKPFPKIAICTVPPAGEDLQSDANKIIQQCNEILLRIKDSSKLSQQIKQNITILPLHEKYAAAVHERRSTTPIGWLSCRSIDVWLMMLALWQMIDTGLRLMGTPLEWVFGLNPGYFTYRNWVSDYIVGNYFSVDCIHFNERFGSILKDLSVQWILAGMSSDKRSS